MVSSDFMLSRYTAVQIWKVNLYLPVYINLHNIVGADILAKIFLVQWTLKQDILVEQPSSFFL